ncbi:MAG: hypothetical protein ACHQ1H_10630 [Nitrososphaerales archaeon]
MQMTTTVKSNQLFAHTVNRNVRTLAQQRVRHPHPTPVPSFHSNLSQWYHTLVSVSINRNAGERVAHPPIISVAHGLSTHYDLTNTATMYSQYCTTGSTCGAGLNNINVFMAQQGAKLDSLRYPCP